MTLARVTAAFFKANKVKYYHEDQSIVFVCLLCGKSARMNPNVTTWSCSSCGTSGNLSDLIKAVESKDPDDKKVISLYNPKRCRYKIMAELNHVIRLLENSPLQKRMIHLKSELSTLIDHYEKRTP